MIGPTPPLALVLTTHGKDQAKVTTSAAEYKMMWAPRTFPQMIDPSARAEHVTVTTDIYTVF
jgi:hypothetical protein